jgi:hypothetical protein
MSTHPDSDNPARLQSSGAWTRRSFVQTISGMAVASGISPFAWAALNPGGNPGALSPGDGVAKELPRYRVVSWWLTWDDLTWPNTALMDKIRRRADRCADSGVNCCLLFGAHFRWDFMPIWERLHDMIHFVADELHQRQIALFDHHSSVLTHRPRTREEALDIWRRNRHHVPLYPSSQMAERLEFNGSRLNDWRMMDVETGETLFLPAYIAEQYCMNNPAFRDSYQQYLKLLLSQTGIDGLMSDDAFFYGAWKACGCRHCRKRFRDEYGQDLPPVSDLSFWGNRESEAFKDWIEMRFKTSADFLEGVRRTLPPGFPLLTCCSSSDSWVRPSHGMTYQDFIQSCNLVMLEMTGATPSPAGTWDDRIPSQMLHLGIARDHKAGCFGLGYGFFPDTAFFVWALNKFLGSDCWFSTLTGRLNATQPELDALADDSELVEEGYRWERDNPQLFTGEVDTDIAVFFSRATRDYYGQCHEDYSGDYSASCLYLMRASVPYEVATEIPAYGRTRHLVLSSAACLSADERRRLSSFMQAGGTVIATGPSGHYDQRANPVAKTWLEEFGLTCELVEPARPGSFPPYSNLVRPVETAKCKVPETSRKNLQNGWFDLKAGKGKLLWRPERITQRGIAPTLIAALQTAAKEKLVIKGLPPAWQVRRYRDGNRLLIQALPAKVGTILHATLQDHFKRQAIIEKLQYTPLTGKLIIEPEMRLNQVRIHSPDLPEPRSGNRHSGGTWTVDPSAISRFFVLECQL